MLLRKISLKGFLSYYGHKNESGQIESVKIDLSNAPLWLIYGPNGSGKSALFDAITFALYKMHRGGESSFYRLIHDAADKAEVNLEIELNGQRYLVQRTITRTKNSAKVWGIVRYWSGKGDSENSEYNDEKRWPALPHTTNKVEEWVKKNLRMSPETFTSAVVLRQGEADDFLKAKPGPRKKRLLEILDLQFYEKLGQVATERKNYWNRELSKLQTELDSTEKVTGQDLLHQEGLILDIEQKLSKVKTLLQDKVTELKDAQRYSEILGEIGQKEQQQHKDDQLIQRADTILASVRRFRELDKVLVVLKSLWSARRRLATEEKKIEKKLIAITEWYEEIDKLSPELEEALIDEMAANDTVKAKDEELEQTRELQRDLNHQQEQLNQIEGLEEQIREAEEKLRPYNAILQQANEIEQKYQRYEFLRDEILPLLQAMRDAGQQFQDAQTNFNIASEQLSEWEGKVSEAKEKEEECEQAIETKKLAHGAVSQVLAEIEKSLLLLHQKLDYRESVIGQPECPICGSRLDDEKTQVRLANEQSHWQHEIKELENRQKQLSEELKLKAQEKQGAQDKLKEAQATTRRLENELAGYQNEVKHREGNLHRARRILDEARQKTENWIDQLEQLDNLEAEFASLKELPQKWSQLQGARQVESAAQATIDTCRTQLDRLPQWSAEEREQLRTEHEKIGQTVLVCEQNKKKAEEEARKKKSHREGLEARQRELKSNLTLAENDLKNLNRNKRQAEQEIMQQQQTLPPTWADHLACVDEAVFTELQEEFESLSQVEEEERQLQEAKQRVNELVGAIKALNSELGKIPIQHRRPVDEVQGEWDAIEKNAKDFEGRLSKEREEFGSMKAKKKTYEDRLQNRGNAEKELSYYKRLADALGKKGLQAKIVQAAQATIKVNANSTLGRLSKGVWQVELLEDEKGEELEILARDTSQPGTPLRPFEYISGGEKFRVAISLAIAIGQSISGGRTVDTLVIDEGFGSLDEVNRDLLVDELLHLSRDVLQGGRVVVVSHQEDVCEKFGNRYHISKDVNGGAQVQRYPRN